jgi:hypothetical protein
MKDKEYETEQMDDRHAKMLKQQYALMLLCESLVKFL